MWVRPYAGSGSPLSDGTFFHYYPPQKTILMAPSLSTAPGKLQYTAKFRRNLGVLYWLRGCAMLPQCHLPTSLLPFSDPTFFRKTLWVVFGWLFFFGRTYFPVVILGRIGTPSFFSFFLQYPSGISHFCCELSRTGRCRPPSSYVG